ncbi:MAG: hypothetical protein AB1722_10110 [Pseudomonadota bacterium]
MHDIHSEQSAEIISKAVGFVVINWAVAEQSLDHITGLLWHDFDGAKQHKKIPVFLDPKIQFVEKCVAGNSALVDLKDECHSLVEEFKRLGKIRNDLVHSAAHCLSTIGRNFVFAKLDVRNGFHHYRQVELNVDEYPKLVDELIELGRRAHGFAELLLSRADAK